MKFQELLGLFRQLLSYIYPFYQRLDRDIQQILFSTAPF
jgi:hypothetical protein